MNCQSPFAPTRETACGLKPLSIITVNARSVGRPRPRSVSRIISMYLPERLIQLSTMARWVPVKRSRKYCTWSFSVTSYSGSSRTGTTWSRADSANASAQGSMSGISSGWATGVSEPGGSIFGSTVRSGRSTASGAEGTAANSREAGSRKYDCAAAGAPDTERPRRPRTVRRNRIRIDIAEETSLSFVSRGSRAGQPARARSG